MSKWEQKGVIDAEYRCEDDGGELMLSASDVIAFLRHHATTIQPPSQGLGVDAMADYLASLCFKATRDLIDSINPTEENQ